jgi:hypothetical protein
MSGCEGTEKGACDSTFFLRIARSSDTAKPDNTYTPTAHETCDLMRLVTRAQIPDKSLKTKCWPRKTEKPAGTPRVEDLSLNRAKN